MIAKVAAGSMHSLALNMLGDSVYAWGRADYGQLGLSGVQPKTGSFDATPQQVAFPRSVGGVRVKDIVAGPLLSFALFDNHDVYSWGFNETGTTGHLSGNDSDVLRPTKLDVLREYKEKNAKATNCQVHSISGGGQHSLMVIQRYT
jgi:alpha-tubulin suppressor-like RCC1 family protein